MAQFVNKAECEPTLIESITRFPTVVSKWEAKRREVGEGSEGSDDPNDTGGEGESTEASGR